MHVGRSSYNHERRTGRASRLAGSCLQDASHQCIRNRRSDSESGFTEGIGLRRMKHPMLQGDENTISSRGVA